jgi:hypothetical protein
VTNIRIAAATWSKTNLACSGDGSAIISAKPPWINKR